MKILFTGKPNKGSWQIRAVQMAHGFAECVPFANLNQCMEADFIVAVKRVPSETLMNIRASGRPWAWDIIDAYPQPSCSGWSRAQAISWLHDQVRILRPTTVCYATQNMKDDAGIDGHVIYHHHRPEIARNPIRDKIKTIGYEGAAANLGPWARKLSDAAVKIGAVFTDQPQSLSDCDVVVAMRGGQRDCYATHAWKSNVKLANAHGSGTPFIGQKSAGYAETCSGAEKWVGQFNDLHEALDNLKSPQERATVSEKFVASAITVQKCQTQWTEVARQYA